MNRFKQLGEKVSAAFKTVSETVYRHRHEALIATTGAVWAGLSLQRSGMPLHQVIEAVKVAAETSAHVLETGLHLYHMASEPGGEDQVNEMAEYAMKGYLKPLFTTKDGLKMLASTPYTTVQDAIDELADGCEHIESLFETEADKKYKVSIICEHDNDDGSSSRDVMVDNQNVSDYGLKRHARFYEITTASAPSPDAVENIWFKSEPHDAYNTRYSLHVIEVAGEEPGPKDYQYIAERLGVEFEDQPALEPADDHNI
jgi:hypothetical protein